MVSKRTQELLNLDRKHLIHGFMPFGEKDIGSIIEKADRLMCWDTEGKEYLDGCSQLVCMSLGHGQKDIIDAISEQAKKLQFAYLLGKQSNTPIIEYARDLAEVAPEGLDHFFFTSGGSESVETAFKIARLYWSIQGKNKYKIISLHNAYHGSGFGSMAATTLGRGEFWPGFGPLSPGFIHVPSYHCYRCPFHLEYPACNILCAHHLEDVIENEDEDSVAAFIAEPIQGGAGNIQPPPEYWPMVRKICTDHNVLLIGDEVQTAFGRTGRMWALEHWNVKWDIMALGKAISNAYIPFGATVVNDSIYDGLKDVVLFHGWTQQGNPIGAAAASAVLKVINRDKLIENADKIGNYTLKRFNSEFKTLPNVGDISGMGLMIGIELVRDKITKTPFDAVTIGKWQMELLNNGLYVRPALVPQYCRLRYAPPIIVTKEETDKMLDILYSAIVDLKSK